MSLDKERIRAQQEQRARDIVAELAAWQDPTCARCQQRICGHELVMSMAMGFLKSPECSRCLAAGMRQERDVHLEQALAFVYGRECWRAGWRWASENEGQPDTPRPACLWGEAAAGPGVATGRKSALEAGTAPLRADAEWDAGELGCGELLLELRLRLGQLDPGQVLALTSRDPASREELPAWCGLTRHKLLAATPPVFHIRVRD